MRVHEKDERWAAVLNFPDGISEANPPGPDHLRHDPLASVAHQALQTRRDRVHFVARFAGFIKKQNRLPDLDLAPHQLGQIHSASFDIGPDGAGRDRPRRQAQRRLVVRNLLPGDEADLTPAGRAIAPFAVEIARIAGNALAGLDLDFRDRLKRFAAPGRMQVEGSDGAKRCHAGKIGALLHEIQESEDVCAVMSGHRFPGPSAMRHPRATHVTNARLCPSVCESNTSDF